ncbi:MAG TPA: NrfD/PsrC family molybdoenzyme membrane anchor subunit [Acidimicrobiales bacterium]|nr:NrfD/PsrC family molybdoenzyme membrane anchor subunit [Acidimicrobiales bacterium]
MPKERVLVPEATPMSYYGQPILKPPTWKWPIPAYLFTGGLAAGSALAAAGLRTGGARSAARDASLLSMGAVAVSGAFLVHDLGRPSRFYNMLRVFKPTSPMSVGTWIFSAFSAATGAAVAAEVGKAAGVLPDPLAATVSRAGQVAAAVIAPALGTYTAVLIADTSVPAWKEAHRQLPPLFAASATAAGAGAVVALTTLTSGTVPAGPARMAVAGAVAELACDEAMHRRLESVETGDLAHPDLASPYQEGKARTLHRAARLTTLAGVAMTALGGLVGRRRPALAVLGGTGLAAGSALTRFAIFEAGRASAINPVYTAGPQRRRLGQGVAGHRP